MPFKKVNAFAFCGLSVCMILSTCLISCSSLARAGNRSLTITAVGDIMMGTHFPSEEYLPPDDGNHLFDGVSDALAGTAILFGNLEGPLLDEGKCIKACNDPDACFAFKMPERYIHHLVRARFNLLSIANNHIGDFGLKGRDTTYRLLKYADIEFAGIDSRPYCIFMVNGLKIGFSAFAPNVGTPDLRDIESASALVRCLDEHCDIVIVSFHGGAEGLDHRHVTRLDEEYYGENRGDVYNFSHAVIDAGADVVFGHGPHVTRAVELYKDRFIAYSLGNFCTYGRFNLTESKGVAPIIKLTLGSNGTFLSGRVIPIFQEHLKGPEIDPMKRSLYELIELTAQDFPEGGLSIGEGGSIRKSEPVPAASITKP